MFSNSPNGGELPQAILAKKDAVRQYLVEHDALRPDTKIFLTTTQNKEGVSIIDDDIKYMFSENHNKADLEQMAGRVRGNPDTGTGIHALIVVYDAEDHKSQWSFLECKADRALVSHVDGIMDMRRTALEKTGIEVEITPEQEAAIIQEIHRLITLYGRRQLGFKQFPKTLKPALGRFNMTCEAASHHNNNKIIRLTRRS